MAKSLGDTPSFPAPEQLSERHVPIRYEGVSIAFIIFPAIIFVLFLISRAFFAPRNTWDIWVLYPAAFVTTTANSILCLLLVLVGRAGQHTAYLSFYHPDTLLLNLKLKTAAQFVYALAVALPKIALLLLYLRIFPEGNRRARTVIWIILVVVSLHCLVDGIIVCFTICQPFSYQWDPSSLGKCGNWLLVYKVYGIPNILTDLAILALPLPMLSRLQMGKAQKMGLLLTLLTASLGVITAIIRFIEFFTTNLDPDPVLNGVESIIWTAIEPATYFVCSCLPSLRALLGPIDRFFGRKPRLGTLLRSLQRTLVNSSEMAGNYNNPGIMPLTLHEGDTSHAGNNGENNNSSSVTEI